MKLLVSFRYKNALREKITLSSYNFNRGSEFDKNVSTHPYRETDASLDEAV